MHVLFVDGTEPVGRSALPHVLRDGHTVAVAHSGTHEPTDPDVEHLHGTREALLEADGPVERWAPQALIDTFGALARLVAERLDWSWEPIHVPWDEGDHPWNVRHPVIADTTRLVDVLGVTEPDPLAATAAQIERLWEHRGEAARLGD